MASKPGILTNWPWKPLGSFKVLVMNYIRLFLVNISIFYFFIPQLLQNILFAASIAFLKNFFSIAATAIQLLLYINIMHYFLYNFRYKNNVAEIFVSYLYWMKVGYFGTMDCTQHLPLPSERFKGEGP